MLSRVAETIYWIGRYQERAENTARLINVNTNLILDLPKGLTPDWEPLLTILGSDALYHELYPEVTERRIVNFLITDENNPSSIISSLAMARENTRTIREILPREGWELINTMYHKAVENKQMINSRAGRRSYLEQVMTDLQQCTGLLAGAMSHDKAYDFLNLGRKIERADMTTRIIDVRSENTVPDDVPELRPFSDMLWMSMLKSLSGYQMYRQSMQIRISRDDVLKFLFGQKNFPRSVSYCVENIAQNLVNLPNNELCNQRIDKLKKSLEKPSKRCKDTVTLHKYIDKLQLELARLHDDIRKTYFPMIS